MIKKLWLAAACAGALFAVAAPGTALAACHDGETNGNQSGSDTYGDAAIFIEDFCDGTATIDSVEWPGAINYGSVAIVGGLIFNQPEYIRVNVWSSDGYESIVVTVTRY